MKSHIFGLHTLSNSIFYREQRKTRKGRIKLVHKSFCRITNLMAIRFGESNEKLVVLFPCSPYNTN